MQYQTLKLHSKLHHGAPATAKSRERPDLHGQGHFPPANSAHHIEQTQVVQRWQAMCIPKQSNVCIMAIDQGFSLDARLLHEQTNHDCFDVHWLVKLGLSCYIEQLALTCHSLMFDKLMLYCCRFMSLTVYLTRLQLSLW